MVDVTEEPQIRGKVALAERRGNCLSGAAKGVVGRIPTIDINMKITAGLGVSNKPLVHHSIFFGD
jgi:hypothetical protein